MKEKKTYSQPELTVYPDISVKDILTGSDLPILGYNETPLIFY